MPRHTHPAPRAKHGRAHTRYQRQRWIERRLRRFSRDPIYRWGLGRNGWLHTGWGGRECTITLHWQLSRPRVYECDLRLAAELSELLGQAGPVFYLPAHMVPRLPAPLQRQLAWGVLRPGHLAKAPAPTMVSDWEREERYNEDGRSASRSRRKAAWRREAEEGIADYLWQRDALGG
jgi:hypothetical protein